MVVLLLGGTFNLHAASPIQVGIRGGATPALWVEGPQGIVCQVQWSDDLRDSGRWFHLHHCHLAAEATEFNDPTSLGATQRFYRVVQTPSTNMVLIPGGVFQMGDAFNEGNSDERPRHAVNVSAFYLERHEVTKGLWEAVYAWAVNNGYAFANPGSGKAADHPVHTVNWFDAVKWCNARSEVEGLTPCYYADPGFNTVYRTAIHTLNPPSVNWNAKGYRLPTEAEWEKAARAGASGRRFPWPDTDSITHSRANYYSLSSIAYDTSPTRFYHPMYYDLDNPPSSSPVGSFAANPYGLFDMSGNFEEWCWDWYDFSWYSSAGATNGNSRGPASPGSERVLRGGSWNQNANYPRCADRLGDSPLSARNVVGFRCVRGL